MYYNNNIKNLLFDLRSDVNYISLVIICILRNFNSNNARNSFKDYRKISFLMQFIFRDIETIILMKFLRNEKLDVYEAQIISSCYFNSKMEEATVNLGLILLEQKEIIKFHKTMKTSNIYYTSPTWVIDYPVLQSIEANLESLLMVKSNLYELDYNSIIKKILSLRSD